MNGTLTDVRGLSVGHWTDREAATGCTVVLCDGAGVDVRGSATNYAWSGSRPARSSRAAPVVAASPSAT